MKLIHIGLCKTGTTSLQRNIFPEIARLKENVVYQTPKIAKIVSKRHFFAIDKEEQKILDDWLSQDKTKIISIEALVNWNPRYWEMSADKNLEIFGKDSVILITVRKTRAWLTSMYQQRIHQGNIKKPEQFLLDRAKYEFLSSCVTKHNLPYFDVDSFDLLLLKDLYEKRFKKVIFVSIEDINKLDFFENIITLSPEEKIYITRNIANATRENVSYSNLAMDITFAREKVLNYFGIQSITTDGNYSRYLDHLSSMTNNDEGGGLVSSKI